ncbi:hypothetical protein DW322_08225 [Rhodococcus rhodnii]|uniref:Transmembrane protein n=1 Tax=Rhodococcus rhodnii TaxID=38312 RepID=A0A6P2CJM5_9NOCA|nr:gephyrin-like molybdotransferase receptor GlpR [Rhodococcus rhodnii]TXG92522.1 hypothetical protein DW322_08225 [Rhodococcus rhodnii]
MPNSFLVIALVAVWLFVLVPMLVTKRPRILQTTDVALATRVLHRGDARRSRRGPATGHRSDPHWQPEIDDPGYTAEDRMDTRDEMLDDDQGERDLHDADLQDADLHDEYDSYHEHDEDYDDGYRPIRRGRGGFDPEADAIARATRYRFRQRTLLGAVFVAIMAGALALILSPMLWWAFGAAVIGAGGYLVYLRRQVRIEQDIRRRRTARLRRAHLGVESEADHDLDVVPTRLRRPGAVVLEADDEDPAFDHLDSYEDYAYRNDTDHDEFDGYEYDHGFRRAAGQ